MRRFAEEEVDLVVLDIMLPKIDGLEVCKRLRAGSTVPIIMLTARDDELDKVLGLELGADDYITKPFLIREFRSRVRAVLRRAATPHLGGRREETIDRGDVRIDLPRRTVEVRGEPVQLTFVEFELLALLASNPGVVYSRRQLLERLRGRRGLPRAAHDRRARAPSAREDRAGAARAGADPDRARRRLPLPRRMSIPGGIRVKLSLALLVIVGGALLAAYAIVVPSLERRLVDAKLDQQQSRRRDPRDQLRDAGRRRTTSRSATSSTLPASSRTRASSSSASAARREKRTLLSLADSAAVGGSEMESGSDGARAPRRPSAPSAPASGTTGASTPRWRCRCSPAAT